MPKYPDFSVIFKYLTKIPETVKYGMSNSTIIGFFKCLFGSSYIKLYLPILTEGNVKFADNVHSVCP